MRASEAPHTSRRRKPYLSIGVKMQLLFTVLFTIIFVVVFREAYAVSADLVIRLAGDGIKQTLPSIVTNVAAQIDGEQTQALYYSNTPSGPPRTITDGSYWNLVRVLTEEQRIVSNIHLPDKVVAHISTYTYVAEEHPNTFTFIGSSDANIYLLPNGTVNPDMQQPYTGPNFRERASVRSEAMRSGMSYPKQNITHIPVDVQESRYSAFAPIRDKKGKIVGGVGIDMVIDPTAYVWQSLGPIFGASYVVLVVAVWGLSRTISRPLARLTKSVKQVGDGDYTTGVQHVARKQIDDETTILAHVFQQMVDKVAAREQQLVQEVHELKIEIDHVKQAQQVAEITENDAFYDLQRKARELRARAALEKMDYET